MVNFQRRMIFFSLGAILFALCIKVARPELPFLRKFTSPVNVVWQAWFGIVALILIKCVAICGRWLWTNCCNSSVRHHWSFGGGLMDEEVEKMTFPGMELERRLGATLFREFDD